MNVIKLIMSLVVCCLPLFSQSDGLGAVAHAPFAEGIYADSEADIIKIRRELPLKGSRIALLNRCIDRKIRRDVSREIAKTQCLHEELEGQSVCDLMSLKKFDDEGMFELAKGMDNRGIDIGRLMGEMYCGEESQKRSFAAWLFLYPDGAKTRALKEIIRFLAKKPEAKKYVARAFNTPIIYAFDGKIGYYRNFREFYDTQAPLLDEAGLSSKPRQTMYSLIHRFITPLE